MRAAKAMGLAPGVANADKQHWANSLESRLHVPALAEGFTPSTDYRIDRLGVQGGDHGSLFIEGAAYCPGTPDALQNATKDERLGLLDKETYWARIKERKAFQLHQKEKIDARGRVVLRCPALGPSPTVTCPLRELLKTRVAEKERPAVDSADLPDFADKICQQHSVSFEAAKMRHQAQAFDYGSREWDEFHNHARNSIESLNNQAKAGGTERIEDASRRLVRGFGAAQIIITLLITNYNLRKIAAFMSDRIREAAKHQTWGKPVEKTVRRRDREHYNSYTDTYPAGVERPAGQKKRGAINDDTGGPPAAH